MKRFTILVVTLLLISGALFSQVGINTDGTQPDPSAGLDVKFNNKGLLPPRMSKVELNAISNPADGLMVYCIDCGSNGLGAISMYMAGAWYTLSANCMNPLSPLSGIHIPSPTQVEWHWNTVLNAAGYKWNTTNSYGTASDMGTSTSRTETGLTCLTPYTRYVWAYSACGVSMETSLSQTTSGAVINPPTSGTHVPSLTQIVWKWNAVGGATGYRWSVTNDFSTAIDMGLSLMIVETGLTCNTNYTRYVWAYSDCGNSTVTTLTQATLSTSISAPTSGTHVPASTQIVWNWNNVSGATGYKWSAINNYASATDMGTNITKTETGLTCLTPYTRYIWAYSACGISSSTTLTQSTTGTTVTAPTAGSQVPSPTQIVWNWNTVSGATGYKWSAINNYGTATDMGANLTNTETGLTCLTSYTRYIWAYNACGNSTSTILTQSTTGTSVISPAESTHVPAPTQIVWNWNTASGATGYKWSSVNDFASATDMGTSITKTETSLICNTPYTRFVWSYNACGNSTATTLTQTTSLNPPATPVTGTHIPSPTQIVWNWNTVSGATGYKWSVTNNFATATDMGTAITKTETGLTCNTVYTRYVWAYSACGNSSPVILTQTTSVNPSSPISGTHVPAATQIVWNWNSVSGATGYKWNVTPDYNSATDMGTSISKTETGLICITAYTRYVWAYNTCGNSTYVTLTSTTLTNPPPSPTSGTHVSSPIQIVWTWNTSIGATGYKWSATNNYATSTDMGTAITKTETGLSCGIAYTRYVWAYGVCGNSTPTTLTQSTLSSVATPISGDHVPSGTQIVWNWNTVTGATGYKWNIINDYASATDMGTVTTKTETGLTQGNTYSRYVWAYNTCGISTSTMLNKVLFYIGQSYGGGIIFYISNTGQAFISATSNVSNGSWGCQGTSIPGTSAAIGTGQTNTNLIVNGCSTAGIAARNCNNLVQNGYSDWFLPSNVELATMKNNQYIIGGFENNCFWSSTESSSNNADVQGFGNVGACYNSKNSGNNVRCIRVE